MEVTECCRLCAAPTTYFAFARKRHFVQCQQCHSVQAITEELPDPEREKALYLTHENDVDDPRYQAFVSPVTNAILAEQTSDKKGLDYGAGPGPVIAYQLAKKGFDITLYDPFFHINNKALEAKYDFIISCEVIEHFHQPATEFARLRSLLNPGGRLYCMTELFCESLDFQNWYYKNDATHVQFYHADSLPLIAKQFGFSDWRREGRLIVFTA